MGLLLGALGLADSDRVFAEKSGQQQVYSTMQDYLRRISEAFAASTEFFVGQTTTNYKWRYYLPGGGYMQKTNFAPNARSHAIKNTGYWDVALPIDAWETAFASDEVSMAYMTAGDLDRHFTSITAAYVNSQRYEILKTLFRNTNRTFVDPLQGSLTVVPLANGDGTLYPAVIGSDTEADDTHHLESGYAYTAISDTNNPLVTIKNELTEHFGITEGGENIVVVVNSRETPYLQALTDYVPVLDSFVVPGDQTMVIAGRPSLPASFRLVGRSNGVWIAEWDYMPAGYMVGRHMGFPAPLAKRVDPSDTGLGTGGLDLVARESDHPFEAAFYRTRCGYGVVNRLNAVVMELGTGGTYTVPTAYA